MHHYHLDQFAHGDSPVHRLDARAKLAALVAYTAILISFDRYAISGLAPLAIAPLVMLRAGRIPVYFALRRVVILSPFILAMCLLSPLYDHSRHLVAFGPWQLAISGGWLTAADIAVKFCLGVLALTSVMATTPFALLLEAIRRIGAPRVLVMQLSLLYRYLFVLLDEAGQIRRARDFRGAAAAPVGRRLAAVGGAIGSLFVRTLDRSDRIHTAMCARGYDGKSRSLSLLRFRPSDGLFLLAAAAYMVFCRWLYPAWIGRT
jgi:cobalt/nickel transport system permease protein